MSNKLILQRSVILFFFFSFGFLSTYLFNRYQSSYFVPQNTNKAKILFNSRLGKQLSFVNVQMEFLNLSDSNTEVTDIKAYVTLLKTTNNSISYKWNLPDGVQVVQGDLEGSIDNVSIETPQELLLKVAGFSREDKKLISLSANTQIGDTSFGNVGLISSRPEDSYEFIANQNFQGSIQQIDLSSESPDQSLRKLKPLREAKIQR